MKIHTKQWSVGVWIQIFSSVLVNALVFKLYPYTSTELKSPRPWKPTTRQCLDGVQIQISTLWSISVNAISIADVFQWLGLQPDKGWLECGSISFLKDQLPKYHELFDLHAKFLHFLLPEVFQSLESLQQDNGRSADLELHGNLQPEVHWLGQGD